MRFISRLTENPIFVLEMRTQRKKHRLFVLPVVNLAIVIAVMVAVEVARIFHYGRFGHYSWKAIVLFGPMAGWLVLAFEMLTLFPALMASGTPMERTEENLDEVNLTKLTSSDIILGKWAVRVIPIGLAFLSMLPVSLIGFLFNVEYGWTCLKVWGILAVDAFALSRIIIFVRRRPAYLYYYQLVSGYMMSLNILALSLMLLVSIIISKQNKLATNVWVISILIYMLIDYVFSKFLYRRPWKALP